MIDKHSLRRRRRVRMGEGATAETLRDMLAAEGYTVKYFDFPNGYWRSPQADVMRWTALVVAPNGLEIFIGSWDTMTNCVRKGFTIHQSNKTMSGEIEVYANSRRSTSA